MPTFTSRRDVLGENLRVTLERLRAARLDGDPGHMQERCGDCPICNLTRLLDKYLDKVPRREKP